LHPQVSETCSTDYCGQTALEWSKLIGERYVEYFARRNDVRACIFRMSTIYARPSEGNEASFVTHYVESVKHGWPIHLPLDGQPIRDILHVDDFSRACQEFIDSAHASGLYNLGGGVRNSVSLRELVTLVGKQIELEPVIVDAGPLPPNVPVRYVSDLTKIGERLAWQPQIGIAEGLRGLL
jgi:nucleoside-diphosphate-sugar epimerase